MIHTENEETIFEFRFLGSVPATLAIRFLRFLSHQRIIGRPRSPLASRVPRNAQEIVPQVRLLGRGNAWCLWNVLIKEIEPCLQWMGALAVSSSIAVYVHPIRKNDVGKTIAVDIANSYGRGVVRDDSDLQLVGTNATRATADGSTSVSFTLSYDLQPGLFGSGKTRLP